MKNKKAMELSINFIVMLIIAMALFSFGIWFAYKFFGGAEKMRTELDEQTQTQIENLLMQSNERVIIPFNSKTLDKSNSAIFGVGILNMLESPTQFTIEITKDSNYCGDEINIVPETQISFSLAPNQNIVKSFAVATTSKTRNCIYSLTIQVKVGSNNYGSPQKVYIKPVGATSACTLPPSCNSQP